MCTHHILVSFSLPVPGPEPLLWSVGWEHSRLPHQRAGTGSSSGCSSSTGLLRGGLEHLSGNLSFPHSEMKAWDLVAFTCRFGEGISQFSEYVGWGYEKAGCRKPRVRGHEELAL